MHDCILDTLAFFLESTQTVPLDVCSRKHPRTALVLATVAVSIIPLYVSLNHTET